MYPATSPHRLMKGTMPIRLGRVDMPPRSRPGFSAQWRLLPETSPRNISSAIFPIQETNRTPRFSAISALPYPACPPSESAPERDITQPIPDTISYRDVYPIRKVHDT